MVFDFIHGLTSVAKGYPTHPTRCCTHQVIKCPTSPKWRAHHSEPGAATIEHAIELGLTVLGEHYPKDYIHRRIMIGEPCKQAEYTLSLDLIHVDEQDGETERGKNTAILAAPVPSEKLHAFHTQYFSAAIELLGIAPKYDLDCQIADISGYIAMKSERAESEFAQNRAKVFEKHEPEYFLNELI